MPETLLSLAYSMQQMGDEKNAAVYYARVVTDHPLSDRVTQAKQQLNALKQPIPDPNPVALARAQALQREAPPGGVLGKLYTVLKPSPGVSTKTAAASNASQEEATAATSGGSVRGGTGSAAGTTSGNAGLTVRSSASTSGTGANTGDGSDFSIDPKVVQPQPTKKKP
jgi:hypothetical protein